MVWGRLEFFPSPPTFTLRLFRPIGTRYNLRRSGLFRLCPFSPIPYVFLVYHPTGACRSHFLLTLPPATPQWSTMQLISIPLNHVRFGNGVFPSTSSFSCGGRLPLLIVSFPSNMSFRLSAISMESYLPRPILSRRVPNGRPEGLWLPRP